MPNRACNTAKVLWCACAGTEVVVRDSAVVVAERHGTFAHKVRCDTSCTHIDRTCVQTSHIDGRNTLGNVGIDCNSHDTSAYAIRLLIVDRADLVGTLLDSSVCNEARNTTYCTTIGAYIGSRSTTYDINFASRRRYCTKTTDNTSRAVVVVGGSPRVRL